MVLSLLTPKRPFDADGARSFGHFVHSFASEQAAREWTARHPGTFTLSLEPGFPLGRRTNQAAFGSARARQTSPPERKASRAPTTS
jgi:hypothetical protein